ncbi:MAG: response regulator [Segetibacter sp.]
MKVLFVQEKPFLAAALQLTMRSKGFELILSEDTSPANLIINKVKPGVVIADISQENALSYVEEAKKNHLPVIVISANGKENELQQAFDKGADDYICLPLSLSELALRVRILANPMVA